MYKVLAWCPEEVIWITLIETPYFHKAVEVLETYRNIDYYEVLDLLQKTENGLEYIDGR